MTTQISPSSVSTPQAPNHSIEKPASFLIPLMKMPLLLYRLRIGWIFGKRFMLLTHVGRRSGKIYQSVLAVLRFDENSHEIFVVSPWSGSNWYHNIQAAPALEVETAGIHYAPTQRALSPEEIAALFIEFRTQHPIFSRMIARIPGWKINSSYDEFLELAKSLRGVVFQPNCHGIS